MEQTTTNVTSATFALWLSNYDGNQLDPLNTFYQL